MLGTQICPLVNEPQVHQRASAQCDALESEMCLLRCHLIQQRAARCSVEMWRVWMGCEGLGGGGGTI